ncbi:heat shock protein transcriptional repressor HspR [Canibacter oris]|uniref:MerR family transcriptional regulator/heat shock protein HspR n=1 Tax=Canibacter oris TaxID=1365628 RepID=A0A840DPF1_9MICO|nr:MerR family transcriptional regulator [Canibacter oris]MBB4071066.1 MerR family transcriptional regulator/heat shock protein HspR [Canibacter oris]
MHEQMDRYSPVFAIAAAAELAQMHPQTLRQYDRIGLVNPQRTRGNTRRYSLHDIEQLRQVAQLSNEGLSLEGIRRVLQLQNEVDRLKLRVRELERAFANKQMAEDRRVFAAGASGEVITVVRGKRVRRSGEVMVWRPTPDTRRR